MKLVRKKRVFWKRLKNNFLIEFIFNFKFLRKEIKKFIFFNYCKYLKFLVDKLKSNLKKFWFFYVIKLKLKRLLEVVIYFSKGKFVKNLIEKVYLFNEFFSFVFMKIVFGYMKFFCDVI